MKISQKPLILREGHRFQTRPPGPTEDSGGPDRFQPSRIEATDLRAPRPLGKIGGGVAAASLGGPIGNTAARVLMMVPDNFMWPEFQEPYEAYREAGFDVTIASTDGDAINPDKRNYAQYEGVKQVSADLSFRDVRVDDYDAITTVGGTGSLAFRMDNAAHNIVDEALDSGMVTGLICASTSLLASMKNYDGQTPQAEGRTATGYYKVEGDLRKAGLNFVDGKNDEVTVVLDGNLITGRNQQSSRLFGEAVVDLVQARREIDKFEKPRA